MTKRFFDLDDNGRTFTFVATDLEHAKKILADSPVKLVADTDRGEPGIEEAVWSEIAPEDAATHTIEPTANKDWKPDPDPERGPQGYMVPKMLADYDIGDWFSSEY
jgi:hypothetical protein